MGTDPLRAPVPRLRTLRLPRPLAKIPDATCTLTLPAPLHPPRTAPLARPKVAPALPTNTAAARILDVSPGTNSNFVRRAVADHIFSDAAFDPPHFGDLAGLVLLPKALSSLADAPP